MRPRSTNTRFVSPGRPIRRDGYGRKKLSVDKGERFEVRYKDGLGAAHIWTWTDSEKEIQRAVAAIESHPVFHSPRVIDRRASARGAA